MKRSFVLLSVQRALLGSITKNMRAITVRFNETEFKIRVYLSVEQNALEEELIKDILDEVSADCTDFKSFKSEILMSNTRVNKLENLGDWVYMEYYPLD